MSLIPKINPTSGNFFVNFVLLPHPKVKIQNLNFEIRNPAPTLYHWGS